jgi:N-acetylmuramic acid 6-phosphate etherase
MGSTRLKAGTAQKIVLNMVSTGAMIKLGKVYGNLMVDLQTNNLKLHDRAVRIIMEATGVALQAAQEAYEKSGRQVKVAIVHLLTGEDVDKAKLRLEQAKGRIREALALR